MEIYVRLFFCFLNLLLLFVVYDLRQLALFSFFLLFISTQQHDEDEKKTIYIFLT